MRGCALLGFAVLLVGSFPARADYADTKWGMTVAQVRKLYPGGVAKLDQALGASSYAVVREVAHMSPAVIDFKFRNGRLNSVTIDLGKPRSRVDLAHGTLVRPGPEDAKTIHDVVLARLTEKYGPPLVNSDGGRIYPDVLFWRQTDGDIVSLDEGPRLGIVYRPADEKDPAAHEGL